MPVVSVDIAGERYDMQRSYRQTLARFMGLNIRTFPATSEADKVAAMDEGLRVNGITATISGVRASQTENRAAKRFVEWNERNGTLSFHPLLDWPDAKAEFHILEKLPEMFRHPDFAPGARSQGGAILGDSEDKTECGLHT